MNISRRFLLCIIFLAVLVKPSYTLAQIREIPLTTGEWAPYVSEKLPNYGFFAELVTAVFKEMNAAPKYSFYPWKRAEDVVAKGKAYAALPYSMNEQRQNKFDFTDPLVSSLGTRFFYLKKHYPHGIRFSKLEDLRGHTIGGVNGYWYEKDFRAAGLNVDYAAKESFNIRKLLLGRIDMTPINELVGWYLIYHTAPFQVKEFAASETVLNIKPFCLMVSRKYPDSLKITEEFNAALKRIQRKGIYSEILKRYGVKDTISHNTIDRP